jgi:hypothetical protein
MIIKQMRKSCAWYCAALAALFTAAVFCGCAGDVTDNGANNRDNTFLNQSITENEESENKAPADTGEKRYFSLSVYLVKDNSLRYIRDDFAPADFPEVNCTEVNELFPGGLSSVRKKTTRIKDRSELQELIMVSPTSQWQDVSVFERGLELIVYESKESLWQAVDRLKNRKDITAVFYSASWMEPGFVPIRGKFADQGLDVETENRILVDWFYWSNSEKEQLTSSPDLYSIDYYFGTYNDWVVIGFHVDIGQTPRITVADIVFIFPGYPLVWKHNEESGNGCFYTLQEAYDLHLVTRDDLLAMGGESVRGKFADQGLDVETENRILQDWFYWSIPEKYRLTLSADSLIYINNYYGTYNGSVAVSVEQGGVYLETPPYYYAKNHLFIADGVKLAFPGYPYSRYIWNNGSFYTLQEAYDLHLVTIDDLLAMGGETVD